MEKLAGTRRYCRHCGRWVGSFKEVKGPRYGLPCVQFFPRPAIHKPYRRYYECQKCVEKERGNA